MTTEVHHLSKESARSNWLKGHRTQDHGTRGTRRPLDEGEYRNNGTWIPPTSPRRVKLAEQLVDDFDSPNGIDYPENSADQVGLRKLSSGIPLYLLVDPVEDGPYDRYDFEDDDKIPFDPKSDEYEAAFDELERLLDRNGVTGEDRAAATEAFNADPYVQHELFLLANELSEDGFPTSYHQVDSANHLSDRSKTDYDYDGRIEDDNGDYHVPHMSVRS